MIESPCEICVQYICGRRCNKRGVIPTSVWCGDKNCDDYNDGVDTTLSGYHLSLKEGEQILKYREDFGLFTF